MNKFALLAHFMLCLSDPSQRGFQDIVSEANMVGTVCQSTQGQPFEGNILFIS